MYNPGQPASSGLSAGERFLAPTPPAGQAQSSLPQQGHAPPPPVGQVQSSIPQQGHIHPAQQATLSTAPPPAGQTSVPVAPATIDISGLRADAPAQIGNYIWSPVRFRRADTALPPAAFHLVNEHSPPSNEQTVASIATRSTWGTLKDLLLRTETIFNRGFWSVRTPRAFRHSQVD